MRRKNEKTLRKAKKQRKNEKTLRKAKKQRKTRKNGQKVTGDGKKREKRGFHVFGAKKERKIEEKHKKAMFAVM